MDNPSGYNFFDCQDEVTKMSSYNYCVFTTTTIYCVLVLVLVYIFVIIKEDSAVVDVVVNNKLFKPQQKTRRKLTKLPHLL